MTLTQEARRAIHPIPQGYHNVTPYLYINGAAAALDFYKKAFGATELFRMGGPEGKVGHAEMKIGDSTIMMADEFKEMGNLGPRSRGGTTVSLLLYVDDVDKTFANALAAGAKQVKPIQDQFYGDRSGMVEDPFGHTWTIATHMEDVSVEEMERRMMALPKKS